MNYVAAGKAIDGAENVITWIALIVIKIIQALEALIVMYYFCKVEIRVQVLGKSSSAE